MAIDQQQVNERVAKFVNAQASLNIDTAKLLEELVIRIMTLEQAFERLNTSK